MKQNKEFYAENLSLLSIIGVLYDEQETIVSFTRGEDIALITTTDPTVFTQLKKRALTNPEEWELDSVTIRAGETNAFALSSATFSCPKRLISFRTKTGEGRRLTDEQKAAAAERLKKAREQKQ